MTKLLYIPNGQFLYFDNYNNHYNTDISKYEPQYTTELLIHWVICNCSDRTDWLERNGIEDGHRFLESEFEVIYD